MNDFQKLIVDAIHEHLMTAEVVGDHRCPVTPIECRDGARFSVQASQYHYCSPRNDAGPWTHVEVMPLDGAIPTKFECATDDVAGYVPIEAVADEILSRGFLAIE